MILTDDGIAELTDLRTALAEWLRAALGMPAPQPLANNRIAPPTIAFAADTRTALTYASASVKRAEPDSPLTADEQRARVIALRGMSQAREGDLAAAENTFGEAVTLDPELDLRRLPGFWQLPRQIQDAAVGALLIAGRSRDASALIADLKTRYRPRLLPRRDKD